MNEYFFMYFLAFAAVAIAAVQDIRTREIANWITFSLIAFVLAYRAFYSIYINDISFFIYGAVGVLIFTAFGHLFYYSRVFAGGDAKLLFGLGGIFPYSSVIDYLYYGAGFIFALFTFGIVYTLIYSFFLVRKNYPSFRKSFSKQFYKAKYYFVLSILTAAFVFFSLHNSGFSWAYFFFALFVASSPALFAYVRAVEASCMVKEVTPDRLTEGDWLLDNVKVGGRVIRKTFAGITYEEIILLRKKGKRVWIKNGVPFAPAFLFSLLFFILFVLRNPSWQFLN